MSMHDLERETVQIIPAQPGWFFIEPIWDDVDGKYVVLDLIYEPIIGWLIEVHRQGNGEPLTVEYPIMACECLSKITAYLKPNDKITLDGVEYERRDENKIVERFEFYRNADRKKP